MESIYFPIVFAVGAIAGSFGTLVGGNSLITIPLLIFLGLPPHIAIGTNRFDAVGGLVAGLYKFQQKGMVDYKIGLAVGIPAVLGSIVGAHLVLQINEVLLKKIIAIFTMAILAFIVLRPQLGIEKTKHVIKHYKYALGAMSSLCIGTYGGFYGAGIGTFLSYLLILLFGQTFLESAGTRKIATLSVSVMAAMIFAISGVIIYSVGIVMFTGLFIGSYIGAHYADKIGNVWLKRLFFVVVATMAIKLVT